MCTKISMYFQLQIFNKKLALNNTDYFKVIYFMFVGILFFCISFFYCILFKKCSTILKLICGNTHI